MNAILSYWPSLALLCLSAIPASFMHVHDHGKLPHRGRADGFFGWNQQVRKYKWVGDFNTGEPAFWGSETFLIMFVDAYHASQALMRILMSLSITLAIGAPWWSLFLIWGAYATIHALFYKLLSR